MLFFNGNDKDLGNSGDSNTGLALFLGYNAGNNRQMWMGHPEAIGDPTQVFLRHIVFGESTIDAVTGDGSTVAPISIEPFGQTFFGDTLNGDDGTLATVQIHNLGSPVSLNVSDYNGSSVFQINANDASSLGSLVQTAYNTLDDGSGNTSIFGYLSVGTFLDLSNINAGSENLIITPTNLTPSVSWGVNTTHNPNAAPAGYIQISVGGNVRYVPFWA